MIEIDPGVEDGDPRTIAPIPVVVGVRLSGVSLSYAAIRSIPVGRVSAVSEIGRSGVTDTTFGFRRRASAAAADPVNWKPLIAWV